MDNCSAGITYNCGSSIGGSGNCVCGAADKYADMEPDIWEEKKMTDNWKKAILENVPHGEEGYISLSWEDAITWAKILNKRGYAVLFTGGEIEDEVKVSWLYAGDSDNLNWADYDNVVFTNVDYIDEYPAAYYKEYGDKTVNEGDEEDK